MDSIPGQADDPPANVGAPFVLPGAWQNWGEAPAGAVLRLDPAAGEIVLEGEGRELRLLVANRGVPALLHAALALHANVPAATWPGDGGFSGAVKAPAPLLSGRDEPGTAAARTVVNGVQHFLANLPAVLAGDVEGVHQLRVAIRRLRTVLVLFEPCLPPGAAADELDAILHAFGRTLGGVRDWDVFCVETLPHLPGNGERAGLEDAAADRRRAARAEAVRGLPDEAVILFARTAATWAAAATQTGRGERLKDVAPALLSRLERKVRRRGRHVAELGITELHALRRANKKLRYGVEYLRPLFPGKRVKPFLHACEQLGVSLGAVNDAAHAAAAMANLAAAHPELAKTTELTVAVLDSRREEAASRARDDWRAWKAAKPFWA